MVTLTGKIADVTGRAPDSISSITVKAPSARIGGGTDFIVSSPAEVTFDKTTGDITISGLHVGLSWLYIEGDGWSDSIPLAVAEGFQLILEAVANASGIPGIADYVSMLRNSESHARLLARAAVDGEIGEVVRLAQTAATTAAESAQAAESNATNAVSRVEALESMAGLSPESPVDGQTANLISQQDTLTRSAVLTAVESRVDGRFLPNDTTYGLVPRLVHHGRDSATPRPDTDGPVIWLGVPMPAHSQPGDVLMRPAGVEWAPDWLNLVGWYDASTLPDGHTVTYVEDLSGHGNHLTTLGGTGAITVGITDLARPGFRFNGDSWITSGVLPAGAWRHPTTVYLVANVEDQEVPAQTLIDGTNNSTRFALWKTQTRLLGMRQTVGVTSGTAAFTAGPHLIAGVFSGDGQSRGEIDGTVVLGPADVGTATPSAIRLGGSFQGTNGVFGSIGEVIIARDVSPEDHQQVTDYLMEKWGIV